MSHRIEEILDQVTKIVGDEKLFDKERLYPPFDQSMRDTAEMASKMIGKEITGSDLCLIMVAIKLNRQNYSHKEDNILDGLAYLAMAGRLAIDDNEPSKSTKKSAE